MNKEWPIVAAVWKISYHEKKEGKGLNSNQLQIQTFMFLLLALLNLWLVDPSSSFRCKELWRT